MNNKKAAQRIANAICELDAAAWLMPDAMSAPVERSRERRTLERLRQSLWKLLSKLGYELVALGRSRIKRRQP